MPGQRVGPLGGQGRQLRRGGDHIPRRGETRAARRERRDASGETRARDARDLQGIGIKTDARDAENEVE